MLFDPRPTLDGVPAIPGPDGRLRCSWAGADAVYLRYHDEEWGVPLHGDGALFEKLSLEGFQSGLSWLTILRRRDAFRAGFDGFDVHRVADYGSDDLDRLMADIGIIRNRQKIEAVVGNARVVRGLLERDGPGALDRLVWAHAPGPRRAPRPVHATELPASTAESTALARALRREGLRFVGPITAYALMQSGGLVDDHLEGCWRAGD